jgi:condensin complex subunit 2
LKKFDLEFSVDPLFKKTSADFDEGGAKGLLLNHLSLDGEGRIVFDAGDTVLEEDEEEAEISKDEGLDLDLTDLQGNPLLLLSNSSPILPGSH